MGEPSHRSVTRAIPQILLIAADCRVRGLLGAYLQENGCRVTVAARAGAVAEFVNSGLVDVLVLDRMLPNDDVLSVCRRLRNAGNGVALIMFSPHDCEQDRVAALDAGADDYLVQPFAGRELLARIRALLRRCRIGSSPAPPLDAPAPAVTLGVET